MLALLMAAALAAIAFAVWFRWTQQGAVPDPALPNLAGVDQEVVDAVQKARDAVLSDRTSAPAWGRLAEVLLAHEFNREANRCFQQAEELDPAEPAWPYLHGLNLAATDPEAAIPYLQRAVECGGSGFVDRQLVLAEMWLERGRLEEAEINLKQAVKSEPKNLRAHFDLGRLALLRQNWRAGLEELTPCTSDPHTRKRAHALCAEAWARLGNSERSRSERDLAAQLPQDQPWSDPLHERVVKLRRGLRARLQSVTYLQQNNRTEEAIQLLNQTLKHYPTSLETWMRLGQTWEQLNGPERAQPCYQQVADLAPDMPEAWFRLACVQARLHSRQAEESFQKAIRLRPHHAQAHFTYGQWLAQQGKRDAARAEFQETLRCRPDFDRARKALGDLGEQPTKPR